MEKYRYYITSAEIEVYPANDVQFTYTREPGEAFYRLSISNAIDFQDRVTDNQTYVDYTTLKDYEEDRYVLFKVYQLQDDDTYDLFIEAYLNLTGNWQNYNRLYSLYYK